MNPDRRISQAAIPLAVLVLFSLGSVAPGALTGLPRITQVTAGQQSARPASGPDSAVLVELFTSEGCSTCPPADKLLTDLDEAQPVKGARVIALSEHVDYWNHLGWKDPFSSAEFTRRQSEYAQALGNGDTYTPQMIVDGRIGFVGSNTAAARQAIAQAAGSPKAAVGLTVKTSAPNSVLLAVTVENIPEPSRGDRADVLLAITESGLMSNVARGENSGRKLSHSAVIRKLIRMGTVDGTTFRTKHAVDLDPRWKRQNMKAVAFVQERSGRKVLGAAAIGLAAEP